MNTVSTTTPSQREANIVAFAQAASTMFIMDAMLSHRPRHLKMPRPGAYLSHASLVGAYGFHGQVKFVRDVGQALAGRDASQDVELAIGQQRVGGASADPLSRRLRPSCALRPPAPWPLCPW